MVLLHNFKQQMLRQAWGRNLCNTSDKVGLPVRKMPADKKRSSSPSRSKTKKQKTEIGVEANGTCNGEHKEIVKESTTKRTYPKDITKESLKVDVDAPVKYTELIPNKNKHGELVFPDWPEFRPNMTPKEVLQAGSFGGTYFRPIKSSVTGKSYRDVWKELPEDWLEGLDIRRQVSSPNYNERVNTYEVKCGGSLEMWESSGWMHPQDPYGWFQWYCRFYQGRRTLDDDRQVGRWLRCAGRTGRWKGNLIAKCARSGCSYDNFAVSPVVRQTLQHWGYRLTKSDYEKAAKKYE